MFLFLQLILLENLNLNLVDVKFGDSGVEHKIEIVKHRHDLHRRAFAGQCSK